MRDVTEGKTKDQRAATMWCSDMKKREMISWREHTRGKYLTLCLPLCNLLLGIAIRPVLPYVTPEQRFASRAKATEITVWGKKEKGTSFA